MAAEHWVAMWEMAAIVSSSRCSKVWGAGEEGKEGWQPIHVGLGEARVKSRLLTAGLKLTGMAKALASRKTLIAPGPCHGAGESKSKQQALHHPAGRTSVSAWSLENSWGQKGRVKWQLQEAKEAGALSHTITGGG